MFYLVKLKTTSFEGQTQSFFVFLAQARTEILVSIKKVPQIKNLLNFFS